MKRETELNAAVDADVSWNLQIFLVHGTRDHTDQVFTTLARK